MGNEFLCVLEQQSHTREYYSVKSIEVKSTKRHQLWILIVTTPKFR